MKKVCLEKNRKRVLKDKSPIFTFHALMFVAYSLFAANVHAQTITSNAVPAMFATTTGGFELPNLPASPGFQYRPTVTNWTLTGNAGIARDASPFTAGNPNAPQGDQVLFLQITGAASTTITPATAGFYRLNLFAAKRGNGGGDQRIAIEVDGVVIDTVTPTTTTYINYKTTVRYLTAAAHNVVLRGLSPLTDNTAFVDNVRYEKLASWSDPTSWSPATVPGTGNSVVISAGHAMVLDVNSTIKNLHINGNLVASRQNDLALTSDWIMVNGSGAVLDWGTASAPYRMKATIRLTGTNTGTDVNGWGAGEKFIGARDFATIDIHGEAKPSWTQLGATANKNANTIVLKETMPWSVGDSIVITSTDFNPAQAEQRAIMAISGTTITLNAPLTYMHYGVTNTYNGLTLDERAEVGLLTRNIRIVGDNPINGFGGHGHFQMDSKVRFSGVELYNMGQKGILGRYPFHWHHLHDISGMYFRYNSVVKSFNRVIAIHESNNGLIENNVAYDHIGHGFYLEDNVSTRNVFYRNLGVLTRVPAAGENIESHDRVTNPNIPGGAGSPFVLPATFWINHPDNDFIENVAAGSDGTGFWYLGQVNERIGINNGNRSHSNTYNLTVDGNLDVNGDLVFGHFRPIAGQTPLFNALTSFKSRERGVWTRGDAMHFDNCRLGDCPRNTFFASNQELRYSLIVGESPNVGNFSTSFENAVGRSLALPNRPATDEFNIFYGQPLYDGPSGIKKVHFAEFNGNNAFCFSIFAAAVKSPVHWADSITFDATVDPNSKFYFAKATDAEMMFTSGLIDISGSITGVPGATITPKIIPNPAAPIWTTENTYNRRPGTTEVTAWGAYVNSGSAPRLNLTYDFTNNGSCYTSYPQYAVRSDGPAMYNGTASYCSVPVWHQNPVFVNDTGLKYYWQRHNLPYRMYTELHFANNKDSLISVFPNVPSGIYVYGNVTTTGTVNNVTALPKAPSYAALKAMAGQGYFVADNMLYLKQVASTADEPYANTPYGYGMKSTPINICYENNCLFGTQTQERNEMTLADFELGPDSRFSMSKVGDVTNSILSYDATAASNPNDGINNKVSWTITKGSDGVDDYVDVNITFPRQVWTEFKYVKFNYSGAQVQVIVHDNGNGDLTLGTINPGGAVNIALNPAANKLFLDNVTGVTLRVRESGFTGSATTINLFNVALSLTPTSTISIAQKEAPDEPAADAVENILNGAGDGVKVYPMPFNDVLNVQLGNENNYALTLYDVAGREVMKTVNLQGGQKHSLDLSYLGSGIYLLNIESAASRQTVKVVKQ